MAILANDIVSLGAIAAITWGLYVVLLKIASNPSYLGLSWSHTLLGLSVGVIIVPLVANLLTGDKITSASLKSSGFLVSLVAGVLWAIGLAVVLKALGAPGTDVSRLVVVYNLNTIVAVVFGIVLLKEIPNPENRIEVIIGALLAIIGTFLATRGA